MIRPGTPGSDGLHLFLPLICAGLAGEQDLSYVVGTVHVSSNPGIQEHIGRDGNSMICSRTSYAPSVSHAISVSCWTHTAERFVIVPFTVVEVVDTSNASRVSPMSSFVTTRNCTVLYCTVLYCTVLYCTVPEEFPHTM